MVKERRREREREQGRDGGPGPARSEARVLYNLAVKPVEGDTHKARLESFYGHQAGDYDAFRKRLLTGREELMADVAARCAGCTNFCASRCAFRAARSAGAGKRRILRLE